MPDLFFIWFGGYTNDDFDLMQYITIKSALVNAGLSQICLYTECVPSGDRFKELEPFISIKKAENYMETELFRKSDVLRFELLYNYGGIYSDLDMLFLSPIGDLVDPKRAVLGELGESGGPRADVATERAFVSAPAGNDFCVRARGYYASRGYSRRRDPNFTFEKDSISDDVLLLRPSVLYPVKSGSRFLRRLHAIRELPQDTRAIHLWRHCWPKHLEQSFQDSMQSETLFGNELKKVFEANL